jgi:hypothetical protein
MAQKNNDYIVLGKTSKKAHPKKVKLVECHGAIRTRGMNETPYAHTVLPLLPFALCT